MTLSPNWVDAHIACEQVSNILTKIIEKGRIASYLEQSTRYVYYNKKINGQYHYVIPPEIAGSPLESLYKEYMDFLFDTYTEILEELTPILKKKYPQGEKQTDRAWEAIIRAKACDIVRGLLPASTRSNLWGCTRMDKPLNTCWLKCTQAIMPRSYNMPI